MSNVTYSTSVSIEKFKQIQIEVEPEQGIAWLYLRPFPRPCFNTDLIAEVRHFQTMLQYYNGKLPYKGELVDINYHIVDSQIPGIFNFGGDLGKFFDCINERNEEAMYRYGKSCIDTIYPLMTNFDLPITNMTLVRGDALGGGFEVALSSGIIVAEKGSQMGFPEILFNMFPGMGGYQLLRRRLSASRAEEMLLNGRIYSAEEMYSMGIVDVLAEKGEGREAVYSKIKSCEKHRKGMLAMQKVVTRAEPVDYDELLDVCKIWVQAAMDLSEKDLKMMKRLVKAQDRKVALAAGNNIPLEQELDQIEHTEEQAQIQSIA